MRALQPSSAEFASDGPTMSDWLDAHTVVSVESSGFVVHGKEAWKTVEVEGNWSDITHISRVAPLLRFPRAHG